MLRPLIAVVLSAACGAAALAADRAKATVDCKAAGAKFTYDCTIKLGNARTSAAIDNAEVTVGADMPSMPMAHNVKPVTAKATGTPGEYQARLTLEMYGDWALQLKIGGPIRDQLVEVRNFDEKGSRPPRRKAGSPGSGHKH